MDFDGDGILDMISGSYDPGDLYLFRGLGKGKFAARKLLRDEKGVPLVHHPKELVKYHAMRREGTDREKESKQKAIQYRVASFGSWPAMVDWDDDGDLDMLIGSFGGELYLRMNKGTRKEPVFAAESTKVRTGGKPVFVGHHANPVVTDWDGDGLWDLVIAAGDGSVSFFRNEGTKKKPEFAAPQVLLEACAKNIFMTQYLAAQQTPKRGPRAQICVVDYNGDGKSDLLVGDYSNVFRKRDDLTENQRANLARLIDDEKKYTGDPDHTRELAKVIEAKRGFFTNQGRQSFVWLYLRKVLTR